MVIECDHIVPVPLKDRLLNRSSNIWNVRFSCAQGELIKIKAPSGTGKTTFIHFLYSIRNDYEGVIRFDDTDIAGYNGNRLAQIRQYKLSIIFQDLRLFPNLTARENIELKRILQPAVKNKESVEEMAELLGIQHILDQKAGICSYGEQQRVAIIRALMQPFTWLIMDEPFSHLDSENTKKAAGLILRECKERNAGLIMTDLENDNWFPYNRQLLL